MWAASNGRDLRDAGTEPAPKVVPTGTIRESVAEARLRAVGSHLDTYIREPAFFVSSSRLARTRSKRRSHAYHGHQIKDETGRYDGDLASDTVTTATAQLTTPVVEPGAGSAGIHVTPSRAVETAFSRFCPRTRRRQKSGSLLYASIRSRVWLHLDPIVTTFFVFIYRV
jgi:hypothetical protein